METRKQSNRGSVVIGIVLVVVGAVLFAEQFTNFRIGAFTWPLFIILPGLAFFAGMIMGGKKSADLAVPGSIITTVGLLLLYQNLTGHWESWAYAWALLPAAVGVGMIISGQYGGDTSRAREGRRLIMIGLTMLVIGFVFFELVIGISDFASREVRRFAGPTALIVLGVLILFGRVAFRAIGNGEPSSTLKEEAKPTEDR